MTFKQNLLVTFLLVTVNGLLSLSIKDIGSAMTLVGSTINPLIGFIMPVVFYWNIIKD
jgi:hypothetical protein